MEKKKKRERERINHLILMITPSLRLASHADVDIP